MLLTDYQPIEEKHKTGQHQMKHKKQHKTVDSPKRWTELTPTQQQKVNRYIETLLAEQLPLIDKPNREVVEQKKVGSYYYQLEKVRCGKAVCRCASGELHGPYWYAYKRNSKGKMTSKYIGKQFKKLD